MSRAYEGLVELKRTLEKIYEIISRDVPSICVNALIRANLSGVEDHELESFIPAADCKLFHAKEHEERLNQIYQAAMGATSRESLNRFLESINKGTIGAKLIELDVYVGALEEVIDKYPESARRAKISPNMVEKLRPPYYCFEIEGGCTQTGVWYQKAYSLVKELKERVEKETSKIENNMI